jgi:UrcA family protein
MLGAAAQAQPSVRISDLNLATTAGKATFDYRTDRAASQLCGKERNLALASACKAAVRAEVTKKLAMMTPATQFAAQHATHTQRSIQMADLNLATTAGKATFDHRTNSVADRVCGHERDLSIQRACKVAVRAEVTEKLAAINAPAQLAAR